MFWVTFSEKLLIQNYKHTLQGYYLYRITTDNNSMRESSKPGYVLWGRPLSNSGLQWADGDDLKNYKLNKSVWKIDLYSLFQPGHNYYTPFIKILS